MEPCLQEIKTALAKQGIAATGPWFTHPPADGSTSVRFRDLSAGEDPYQTVAASNRAASPAAKVAQTTYHGPYEGLGKCVGASS